MIRILITIFISVFTVQVAWAELTARAADSNLRNNFQQTDFQFWKVFYHSDDGLNFSAQDLMELKEEYNEPCKKPEGCGIVPYCLDGCIDLKKDLEVCFEEASRNKAPKVNTPLSFESPVVMCAGNFAQFYDYACGCMEKILPDRF